MVILKKLSSFLIVLVVLFFANSYVHSEIINYIENDLEIPRGGIVFVDNFHRNSEGNGSIERPFKTINLALDFTKENRSFKIIRVRKGVYEETLILPENIIISGETDGKGKILTSIRPLVARGEKTIIANNNNRLLRLSIEDGKYNLYIPKDKTRVILSECKIAKASKWGIYNEEHTTNTPTLDIVKTLVTENKRQGAYLQKSTVTITDSAFIKNGEEGIDLHVGMNTFIQNVEVIENLEGGLETEIGNIDLVIQNSKFIGNGSSGINLQSFEEDSVVEILNNTIEKNTDFGIRCALHAPIKSPYFKRMVGISDDNIFRENGKVKIDPNCKNR